MFINILYKLKKNTVEIQGFSKYSKINNLNSESYTHIYYDKNTIIVGYQGQVNRCQVKFSK